MTYSNASVPAACKDFPTLPSSMPIHLLKKVIEAIIADIYKEYFLIIFKE